ncbi:hypothetical protein CO116_03140 [Candidatus Falkowbacteria bacterium CG_4_9_14_3_um_filter_38_19]|uniref:Translation elongation factor EFTu-like domain-containing protein n=2 Tax=Candidatus Falkowiibacteriota TaxID=1752728 RepID=A0A2M6WS04_9BACT|nr:hypothetical protein [Candidatus Falkowbacteria bacterium]PIT95571.1 MAG: hypothetical protein COT96_00465 [Candidatus Falkowbacteria bacterium CG10_big_fil_rev_8_21_14_0_10_38_22]PJB15804.1 MAG: hypothetical protein CO116_03140 [Candidatus Falkowbacteria bacterium CG_4_9_14_3_um_filter_38_19]
MADDIKIEGEKIGTVTHFFGQIGVAAIELAGTLKVGDRIRIKGSSTDIEQEVNSLQIDKQQVAEANAGQSVGIKVGAKTRVGDIVYKM